MCGGAGKGTGQTLPELLLDGLNGVRRLEADHALRTKEQPWAPELLLGPVGDHWWVWSRAVSGGLWLEEPRGQPAVAGWLWSPFPGPPVARLEIGSERRIHHAQIVQQPPGQREQQAASVPPRQSRDDGLPRTELPPPNFSLSGSQGEIESM